MALFSTAPPLIQQPLEMLSLEHRTRCLQLGQVQPDRCLGHAQVLQLQSGPGQLLDLALLQQAVRLSIRRSRAERKAASICWAMVTSCLARSISTA